MPSQINPDLPVGDLQFYDNYVPALDAGTWTIGVTHTVDGVTTGSLGATQKFVVSAPQYSFDPSSVVNQYPPDGTSGLYGEVLPHIVLKDPLLPWERGMADSPDTPWLALLSLYENEVIGGQNSSTRSQLTTVSAFLQNPDKTILRTAATKEDDIDGESPCTFIQISTERFAALIPRLSELKFLAHCRQSNITDKAEQGFEQNGLFSVVVGNRFPALPAAGNPPLKTIVHLVSLEGLETYLTEQPNFGACTSVALISLASWTFQTLPDNLQDFRGLMDGIVAQELQNTTFQPSNFWLRLPAPAVDGSTASGAEVVRRMADGFVPMSYWTRTGESTFAWYRSPLAPTIVAPLAKTDPFLTADSALIYQSAFGTFDASLAAAWEAGRSTALSDRGFGQTLFDFRRRAHRLTDTLLQRLQSDAFSATQIASLDGDTTVQDEFLHILDEDLIQTISQASSSAQPPAPPASSMVPDPDPKTAIVNFVSAPDVQQKIQELVGEDLLPIATWLSKLHLLNPVPFNLLVPDARMLPNESLRFFYLDQNWVGALLDGALSIGMESSRETLFHSIFGSILQKSAQEAALSYRAKLLGVEPPAAEESQGIISGFLLRSGVVAGWPNLAVRPLMADGTSLKILRMDHLAPNLLFCLFWGVPDTVELSEPQEGFRFGVDDDGKIQLREPVGNDASPLGTPIQNHFFQVIPQCYRSATDRVLMLSPESSTGLVQQIQAALKTAPTPFGPADFALQMVKSPEAIRFNSASLETNTNHA